MMKKWISYLLLIVLLIGSIPVEKVEAAVDVTKPIFESLSIDKKDVKVGEEVTITVKASDAESGIKRIMIFYKVPQTDKSELLNMSYDSEKKVYVARLMMTEDKPSGVWKPSSLYIEDNAGNEAWFYSSKGVFDESGDFTLSGTSADVTKPVFESLSVDKKDVKVGEEVTITVKASDAESGIKRIMIFYKVPQTDKSELLNMSYDSEKKVYVARLMMTEDKPSGVWKPSSLYIEDNAENEAWFYSSKGVFDESGDFTLSGTSADVTKPVFESLSVDKKDVKVGEEVTITVKASDAESGIKRIMIFYKVPQTDKSELLNMSYDSEKKVYVARLMMTEDKPSGVWKPSSLYIEDNAENEAWFYSSKGAFNNLGEFNLNDYQNDKIPPVFKSLSLSQSFLDQTQPLEIKVTAVDDTKVKGVKVAYRHSSSQKEQIVTLSPSTEVDEYQTSLQLTEGLDAGEWKISSVEVEDLNGNKTIVTERLSSHTFTVFKRIEPLANTFYTESTSLTYRTISGDLYIGPKAVATLNGTTVYGNVYVLGAMRIYGGVRVTGTIYANSFSYGSGSLYQGGVVMSGSNSVSSMTASSDPLNRNVPFKLYEDPIVETDGKVTFSGATVPVVDVTLEGEKLNINSDGTFRVKDYPIGTKRQLDFSFRDIFGNTWTKSYSVLDRSKPVVTSSLSSGIYTEGEQVVLSATKGAKIHYTLDGSTPTSGSPVFTDTIPLKNSMTIRYVAIDALNIQSDINKQQFYTYKVDFFLEESSTLKGRGANGMSVTVLKEGKSVAKTVIGASEQFELKLDQQKIGTRLAVKVEIDGLINEEYSFVVEDHVPPTMKLPLETTDDVLQLKGESEVGATITIYENESKDKQLGKGTAGADGKFSISFERPQGNMLYVVATDASGNVSKLQKVTLKDVTAPAKPVVDQVTNQSTRITGQVEPGAYVTLLIGKTTVALTADQSGRFAHSTTVLPAGTVIRVSATDASNNQSEQVEQRVSDVIKPVISGATKKTIDVGQTFNPSDRVTATDETDGNLTSQIKITGTVDSKRAGSYTLIYTVTDQAGNVTKVSRVITVKDTIKPVISGVKSTTVALNQKFDVRKGVSAKDNVDGTLTKSIKVSGSVNSKKVGTYKLTYSVSDRAGNKTTIIRKVVVKDLTKPVITGATAKSIKYKSSFNPMTGVRATDNLDGSLTKKIKVSGTVNTKKKGSYYLTYRVSDKAGNLTSIKRKIIVK
ncbi:immunoglobulin-like domain-containing protein [Exiguobacterium sp. H66]|uniref:immunoglobulin-like domain-containing protein n=1 Tax=Exiguobacterium sp. H66 TaxID=2751208 RepID=UPI001BE926C3|nr:immunoglobulin-like domain-containing protein [Exiguobacterium sp. H66]